MSTRPNIDITIDEDGQVHLEVNGCEGSVCENLTDTLIQKLGMVEEVSRKPEYFITNDRPDYINSGDGED